jgi:hypothetical protein
MSVEPCGRARRLSRHEAALRSRATFVGATRARALSLTTSTPGTTGSPAWRLPRGIKSPCCKRQAGGPRKNLPGTQDRAGFVSATRAADVVPPRACVRSFALPGPSVATPPPHQSGGSSSPHRPADAGTPRDAFTPRPCAVGACTVAAQSSALAPLGSSSRARPYERPQPASLCWTRMPPGARTSSFGGRLAEATGAPAPSGEEAETAGIGSGAERPVRLGETWPVGARPRRAASPNFGARSIEPGAV